jgi:hypothetical protein
MDKPKMKRKIGISEYYKETMTIRFNATLNATHIKEIKEFGRLEDFIKEDSWRLTVDSRYDFDEVLQYLRSLEDKL